MRRVGMLAWLEPMPEYRPLRGYRRDQLGVVWGPEQDGYPIMSAEGYRNLCDIRGGTAYKDLSPLDLRETNIFGDPSELIREALS